MWFQVAIGAVMLGQYIYHRWFESHPVAPKPNIEVPTVALGAPIPLVYGQCRVRTPILVWYGNQYVPPLGVGDFSLDMTFIVGVPFFGGKASLVTIFAGDLGMATGTLPFATETTTSHRRQVHARLTTLDGHIGGGQVGAGEFWDGSPDQVVGGVIGPGESLTTFEMRASGIDYTLIPGFRNQIICTLGGNGGVPIQGTGSDGGVDPTRGEPWVIGQSPSVSSYSFEVRSLSTGSASDLGNSLANDADPAAVIYDLLTSSWGKLAVPANQIDLPSFQAASATLFAEQHGYSRSIEDYADGTDLIADVIKQIDAVYYAEPTTGKIVLKLVRNDYDFNALDDINPGNAMPGGAGWYTVQGWAETINQVRLTYTDRATNYSDGLAIGQNSDNAVVQGGKLRSVSIRFVGCCTRDLAQRLAARELAAVSRPMVKATVTVTRAFYFKRPGDVVTLTWPDLGINKMVMRIARADFGQLHAGAIQLDLIRDVFDVGSGAYPIPN